MATCGCLEGRSQKMQRMLLSFFRLQVQSDLCSRKPDRRHLSQKLGRRLREIPLAKHYTGFCRRFVKTDRARI